MTGAAAFVLPAALLGFAALIAFGLSFVFARLVGWCALAHTYRAASGGGGQRYASKGVVVGPQSLCAPPLSVALDERGITLETARIFRPAFAPLLIPWQAVRSFEKRSYFLFDVAELRFGAGRVLGFVPSKATEAIAARLLESGGRPAYSAANEESSGNLGKPVVKVSAPPASS